MRLVFHARFRPRKCHGDDRPISDVALRFNIPPMLLDDPVNDRETKAYTLPFFFGGEERIEYLRQILRRDTFSVV